MDQNKNANTNAGDQQRQGGQRPDQNRDSEKGAGGDRQNPNQPGKPGQQGGQQGNQGGKQGGQGGNR